MRALQPLALCQRGRVDVTQVDARGLHPAIQRFQKSLAVEGSDQIIAAQNHQVRRLGAVQGLQQIVAAGSALYSDWDAARPAEPVKECL